MTTFKKITDLPLAYIGTYGAERIEMVTYTGENLDIPTSASIYMRQVFDWGFFEYLPLIGGISQNLIKSDVAAIVSGINEYGTLRYIYINPTILDSGQTTVFNSHLSFGNSNEFQSLQFNIPLLPVASNWGKELALLIEGNDTPLRGRLVSFKNVNLSESMPKTLRVEFNDVLDTTQPLLATNFIVSGGQILHNPVFMNDRTVGLRIDNVFNRQALTLAIASGAVRDRAGNLVAATSGVTIINTGPVSNSMAVAPSIVIVNAADPNVVDIIFNQMLDLSVDLVSTKFTLGGGKSVFSAVYKDTYTVSLTVSTFTAGEAINLNIDIQAVRNLHRPFYIDPIYAIPVTNKVGVADTTPPSISVVFGVPQVYIDSGKPYYIHAGNGDYPGISDVLVLKKLVVNSWHVTSFQEGFSESNYN